MKASKFTTSIIALAVTAAFSAHAADDRYIIKVDESKKGLVKALAKKLGGELKVDGKGFIAASFAGKDLSQVKGLLNNPHIQMIEEDQRRLPLSVYSDTAGNPATTQLTPYAVVQSQADQVNFNAGAGMKVCIIDSGLDRSNQDFIWNNITGTNDSGTGNWDENGGPHGTHVAGTIGAADNGFGVVGMAPGVDMHIVKVFNEAGWGYSSDLAYAANICSGAGANIISMSLGGGGANSTEENAFKAFTDSGGLVVAAAGNDGNNVRSFPAGYSSVMMVGANDNNNAIADFSQFPSCTSTTTTGKGKNRTTTTTTDETVCVEVTAGGVDTLSTYPAGMATSASMSADGVAYASSAMENSGSVTANTFYMGTAESTNSGANGNVCLIDRGVISFHDKVQNCQNSGGVGAVIINNEAGMLSATLGDTNATTIPAVGVALEDRAALLASNTVDIAIGASDYGFMSGTSMATPAVSGMAALVWSNHNGCTGTEIRDALKATAEDNGAAGHDDYFGHGIVKAKAANDYLTANGCGGGVTPPPVEGGDITADASGYKAKGKNKVDVTWSGAATSSVDIIRNGSLRTTTANDGAYTDSFRTSGSFTYKVCDQGTSNCSADITVNF
ncbi:S8 family serine peptidase [Colwellia hornerae]|uniref:S8 family serine peptidase n=1 Tax=Colwellia hornerae TaxID=89402 RepID=A0A5C6QJI9_9GAMM|nr:S8 family serine peptidase [Colwellia hornerae]TWX58564.1 S8 family serine peptidase [Colwellia hornerae]TWX59630.1 S8 family serine peptidase [Colwellia hornerae]TWX69356.1 S8 family serine peptidase [Colwellia hornerae]